MAPSAIVDKPELSHYTGVSPVVEILPMPMRMPAHMAAEPDIPVRVNNLFKNALIEQSRIPGSKRAMDAAVSIVLHVAILSGPILASLYFTDTINLKQFAATMLVAPPPPPPPPPASSVVRVAPTRRVFMNQGKLIAPRYVPEKIANIKEAPIEEDMGGLAGGIPGGVPGGQMGGVIGGVIGGVLSKAAAPAAPKSKVPLRVGGRIRAPKPILQSVPEYPLIAKQAHIAGNVVIDAVIDEQGNVVDMKIVSGPPLLYLAAMNSLKKWKYEPTYLNDTPISVQLIVSITFQLTGAS
jgi:protein TonB